MNSLLQSLDTKLFDFSLHLQSQEDGNTDNSMSRLLSSIASSFKQFIWKSLKVWLYQRECAIFYVKPSMVWSNLHVNGIHAWHCSFNHKALNAQTLILVFLQDMILSVLSTFMLMICLSLRNKMITFKKSSKNSQRSLRSLMLAQSLLDLESTLLGQRKDSTFLKKPISGLSLPAMDFPNAELLVPLWIQTLLCKKGLLKNLLMISQNINQLLDPWCMLL